MRIWSLHPKYLDTRGIVALWRETLLAQAVLRGRTKGYQHHPQLVRFRAQASPLGAVADYLRVVHEEATRRGYSFARQKISRARGKGRMVVTRGQMAYEWEHLLRKLERRAPEVHDRIVGVKRPRAHPSFRIVPGGVEDWEKVD